MAEKTTKKTVTTPKASVKTSKAAPKKATEKSPQDQLMEARTNLLEAQKSHKSGELVNPRVLKTYRRDVARALTVLNKQEVTKESK